MFDVDEHLKRWRSRLQTSDPSDMDELETHVRQEIEDLRKKGLSKEEAFYVAVHRMGDVETLNREFSKLTGKRKVNRPAIAFGILALVLIGAASNFHAMWMFEQLQTSAIGATRNLVALRGDILSGKDRGYLVIRVRDMVKHAAVPWIKTKRNGDILKWKGFPEISSYPLPAHVSEERRQEIYRALKAKARELDQRNPAITVRPNLWPKMERDWVRPKISLLPVQQRDELHRRLEVQARELEDEMSYQFHYGLPVRYPLV